MSKFTAKLSAISLFALFMAFFCSSNAYAVISAPQLLSPNDGAYHQPLSVELSWENIEKATRFEYQVSTTPSFTTTIASGFVLQPNRTATVSGLAKGTTYYWRVRSWINTTEYSAWSNPTRSFTTGFGAPTLVSPADQSNVDKLEAKLTWTGVAGVTIYKVQVSTDQAFATIFYQNQATDLEETVTGLTKGVTYYWRVVGIILHTPDPEDYTETSAVWSFKVSEGIIDQVTLISPANNSTNVAKTFDCTWNAVSNVTGYEIEITKVQGDYSTANIAYTNTPSLTSQTVSTLEYGKDYWWHVRAVSGANKGLWSVEWHFTLGAAPLPGDFNLTTPVNDAVKQGKRPEFTWTASQNATSYTIRYSTDVNIANPKEVTGISALNYTPTDDLIKDTDYYWYVIAVNGSGNKESAKWHFKTDDWTSANEVASAYMLSVSPNPTNADAKISFNLVAAGNVKVNVFDMLGNLVFSANEYKTAGESSIGIDAAALVAGSYSVQFQFGNDVATMPLVIVK